MNGTRIVLAIVTCVAVIGPVAVAQGINRRGLMTAGEPVPILKGYGLDSKPVVVDYASAGRPTVVYGVDQEGSYYVKANAPNFAALVTQAADRYAFVVLCPEDTGAFKALIDGWRPAWGKTRVTVVANVDEETRQAMSLFAFPQTFVVSVNRKTIEVFQGAYTSNSRNATPATIEAFFGITLPRAGR